MGKARTQFSATIVPPDPCPTAEADVYAPCALAGTLSERTIRDLRVSIVAGPANNQLAAPKDGRRLADRGFLYAPDYVINAGGLAPERWRAHRSTTLSCSNGSGKFLKCCAISSRLAGSSLLGHSQGLFY
jgi:hypothetical protein